ncbi:hypothetical protein GS597_00405 [Synechococcales cyanobacterium C]|uniref:Polysaccharide pyruvyl transferase domain-containing protein n=1 Tax=Petrachloros mirabilis ULC683 TaxID=2781853 RepID=A0A8K1ZVT5_9CYAN|nr:polysaccharide pyruvyl transferase family protein [Petrachloros mirabilis]NCJ05006.1 hypothetical protein [Petrachloros mirabilis ULC683]
MFFGKIKEKSELISSQKKSLKIGLMGPWGYGNLGDAAIQTAMIQNLKKYLPQAEIVGFSIFPEETQKRHHIPAFAMCGVPGNTWWIENSQSRLIYLFYKVSKTIREIQNSVVRKLFIPVRLPLEFILECFAVFRSFRIFKDFDAFIVSGGGQLDDVFEGAWQQPYALLLWAIISKLRRTKFLVVSVGAGPIQSTLSKFFFKTALSLADYRSYRDKNSKKYIEDVLRFEREKDPIFPDLAHSLDLTPYHFVSSCEKLNHKVVGLSPIPHRRPGMPPGLDSKDDGVYQNYLFQMVEIVKWLIQQKYKILFFTGQDPIDRPVIEEIKSILHEQGVSIDDGTIIENPTTTVNQLMHEISRADWVIASRFHSILLSLLLEKPVLALSFHDKIDSLMRRFCQSEYCLSLDSFELNQVYEKFLQLVACSEQVGEEIAQENHTCQNELEAQYRLIFGTSAT